MDSFCEQIVKKKSTAADAVKIALTILGTLVVIGLCVFLAAWFFPILFLAAGAVYLCVIMCRNVSMEYEYIITNNQLDVDKILGKSKRKRMITIDLSKAQDFVVDLPENHNMRAKTTVHASSCTDGEISALLAEHSDYGTVMLIFSPNEKTTNAIINQVPGMLRTRLKSNVK